MTTNINSMTLPPPSSSSSSFKMTYLSIVPNRQGPTPIEQSKPIVGQRPPALLMEKHVSFSSPLSSTFHAQRRAQTVALGTSNVREDEGQGSRLTVRLAAKDVLLPFVDRPKEIKALLIGADRPAGRTLFDQLQTMHVGQKSREKDEWQALCDLLFTTTRDALPDRAWLRALHSIIFARSPRLWCFFVECVGARGIHLTENEAEMRLSTEQRQKPKVDPTGLSASPASLTVDTDEAAREERVTYEMLKRIPNTFRKSPSTIRHLSVHEDDLPQSTLKIDTTIGRPNDESAADKDEHESSVRLSEGENAFAAIRIRLPSPLDDGSASAPSMAKSRTNSMSDWSVGSDASSVSFTKQRRLSQLFMTPFDQPSQRQELRHSRSTSGESGERDEEGQRRRSSSSSSSGSRWHQRSRSQSEAQVGRYSTGSSERKGSGLSSTWSKIEHRRRSRGLTEPNDSISTSARRAGSCLVQPSPSLHPPSSAPATTTTPDADMSASVPTPSNTAGLLPDGRTRHPSAGAKDADSNAALRAFRESIRLNSMPPEQQDDDGETTDDQRWKSPLASAQLFSPQSELSEMSIQTPGDVDLTSFGGRRSTDGMEFDAPPLFGSPPPPEEEEKRRAARTIKTPSTLIFPVPPHTAFSRPKILLEQLFAARTNEATVEAEHDDDDTANAANAAWQAMKGAIGKQGIVHVRQTVKGAGERTQVSDEELVERLAKECFGLVDMDMAHTYPQQHLSLSAKSASRLTRTPWYQRSLDRRRRTQALEAEQSGDDVALPFAMEEEQEIERETDDQETTRHEDKSINQRREDEERLQAYFDDLEGYEDRWRAFASLLTSVWLVDPDVLMAIRNRCGPATRLHLNPRQRVRV